jgi:hypothetical protein
MIPFLKDPFAHRRVEKTRRDRMNVSLNKLSSLIPDSFKKQVSIFIFKLPYKTIAPIFFFFQRFLMFDKGITRVDKIKTVDIAIAYVEHLQLICKQYNIKEGEIKISESISIPVANNLQPPPPNVPTKMTMKNLSTLSKNTPSTVITPSTNTTPTTTTISNTNALPVQPPTTSVSSFIPAKVIKTCDASTITVPLVNPVIDSSKNDNLWYMRGIFNGSIELTTFLIESVHTYLSDMETKYHNIELVTDVLKQFHNVYFMSQNISEKDIVFITKGKIILSVLYINSSNLNVYTNFFVYSELFGSLKIKSL